METITKTDRLKLCGTANSPEEAENIFKDVEVKTGVKIKWEPNRSHGNKKEPVIRLCGPPEGVKLAREMVLQNLEVQSNRVFLKMDITHEEHPSLIGKKGSLVKQVMEITSCQIHFPDVNLRAQSIKSNQVSITGDPCNVEKARVMLRALLPFQIMFDIDIVNGQIINTTLPLWKQIEEQLGLDIHFLRRKDSMSVTLRCSQGLFPAIRQQIIALIELLSQKRGSDLPPVKVTMDIMPQNHNFVKGTRGSNIQAISNRTGAKILLPDLNSDANERRHVSITGNLDCVYMAWQEVMSSLPTAVSFDVSETRETNNGYTDFLLDCNINVFTRPKPKYIKGVIVKGPEKFSKQILQYRQRILNLPAIKFRPDIDDTKIAFSFQTSSTDIPVSQILQNLTSLSASGSLNSKLQNVMNFLNTKNCFQNSENNYIQTYNPPVCPPVTYIEVPTVSEKVYMRNEGCQKLSAPVTVHSSVMLWGQNAINNNEAVIKESKQIHESLDSARESFSSPDNIICVNSPLKKQGVNQFEIFEKRLSAHQAIHRQIESTQVPSGLWAGYGFSQSMPAAFINKVKEPLNRCSSTSLKSNSSSSEESFSGIVLADYFDDKIWSNNGDNAFSMSNVFDFKRNSVLPKKFDSKDILPELLYKEGLYNYIDVFLREEIDYAAFLLLNESDLIKLGINYQARMKITCLIRELQDGNLKKFNAAPGAGRRIGEIPLIS